MGLWIRNEAIEIVREFYPSSGEDLNEALETLIPELKENKDEMIRKALIELVRKHCVNETRCMMEEWLEKQGEQNFANSAKTCKDLEKEIKSCMDEKFSHKGQYEGLDEDDIRQIARHIAQWQKEQMMKDAIEATALNSDYPTRLKLNTKLSNVYAMDKVKVIIIKE